MRIVKPTSASNSPRNAATLNRRKTVMADGLYRRRPVQMDQNPGTPAGMRTFYDDSLSQPVLHSSRPLSWHPSGHSTYEQPYQPNYNMQINDWNAAYNMESATPAIFSAYGSPISSFSPPSQPAIGYDQNIPFFSDASSLCVPAFDNNANISTNNNMYTTYQSSPISQLEDSQSYTNLSGGMNPSIYSHFDWNSLSSNSFDNASAPPTPNNFLPIQHPDPPCNVEDPIPYTSLDDEEADGEELIGMGLYDTPEKSAPRDSQLDQYRALMMTQLLGPGYNKNEPTGKGLKLEETWNPPRSDDGEDDDGEGEDDDSSEGDDNEEAEKESSVPEHSKAVLVDSRTEKHSATEPDYYQMQCDNGGWL
jgi:hypothetical protein